jgi:23S rRNA (pseudouridine1915-N3)-methyltransferase
LKNSGFLFFIQTSRGERRDFEIFSSTGLLSVCRDKWVKHNNEMRIRLLQIGKNQDAFIEEGILFFQKKLKHYCSFEVLTLPALKQTNNLAHEEVKRLEGDLLLKSLDAKSLVCLLDERGKKYDSPAFARQLDQWALAGRSQVDFVIGGAFGFSEAVYQRAEARLSLSDMTFSHQLVRIIFLEQLYRAFTILRNEPYHHG